MNLREQRERFEQTKEIFGSSKLKFHGVEGYDVYNPSIPFAMDGTEYIYGRVERRAEWAKSTVRLFERTGDDDWTLVQGSMAYQLEDPYVSFIHGELVLGGTHVRYKGGKMDTYFGYFYRGSDINGLSYFTTGPEHMKDIRIVETADGRIGVFSRPRNEEIMRKFGCESQIGFTIIDGLDDLSDEVIEQAPYIPGLFADGEWGGCNQAYLLDSGKIGVIGHKCYNAKDADGLGVSTYMNIAFVFDPERHEALDVKIIGTRPCYPAGPAKIPSLVDCAFTSGIAQRKDGKVDLYSGIGDTEAGRIVIDYPFSGYGRILCK